ncbi:hypothetical protein [Paraburkholderia fungorum]|uniref:Uncharacterized protein n=1 Tax=Paraburkholderia fungorum TaxID=134537 RepID=A0A3R7LC97_9BURK|nr:hypothetical protein [Paraburkholderia fungorum]RKF49108.1 hypothetical protein BCY88_18495 [Paraburkholderia fungorum]
MPTTLPLTLIEGSMALPSLSSQCRRLPPPFGRAWALVPPVRSLRAELKALYAAVLRTFCVNAETIRALCHWESPRKPPAASSAFASPAPSTTVLDAPAGGSFQTSTEAAPFSPVSTPMAPASPRGGSMHWGALAGGACALGGAAMLAWIAFGHPTQRHSVSDVKPAAKVPVRQEAQLSNRHASDAAATPQAAANNRALALAPNAASLPAHVAGTSGSAPASSEKLSGVVATAAPRDVAASPATGIVAPVKATPPRAATNKKISRRRDKLRASEPSQHKEMGRSSLATVATQRSPQLPGISLMNYEAPQIAVPAIAQRTSPKPSAAGPYSPLAPSRLGTDEYASTTLSASTHLRNITPPSRPASSINPPGTNGTEWINQMSQRRVTEVPDQFVK